MAYIKLGPIGKYFASNRLGIFLNERNAVEVSDSMAEGILRQFILTGYMVYITKVEYDNIKINQRQHGNYPVMVVGTHPIRVIEPVVSIMKSGSPVPIPLNIGERYLIHPSLETEHSNKIAEWDGSKWDYTLPTNGTILPIYTLGIAYTYTGTYPSGTWNFEEAEDEEGGINPDPGQPPEEEDEWATEQFVLDELAKEAKARSDMDNTLLRLIQQINISPVYPTASQVPIIDVGNNFDGNNVELALAELAQWYKDQQEEIENLQEELLLIWAIIGSGGYEGNVYIYANTDEIDLDHEMDKIPSYKLLLIKAGTFTDPNELPDDVELEGVLAEPENLTKQNITFHFAKEYPLVLILK